MKPEKIMLTHGHIDHAGGAAELKERLGGMPIEGPHEAERPLLDSARRAGPGLRHADGAAGDARPLARRGRYGHGLAGHTFEVLHCPGHSPGSVVLVNRAQRFALVGDVLFQGSIGRTDLPMGSHEALLTAIRTKLLPLGDEFAFICGHGPMSTIGHERQHQPVPRWPTPARSTPELCRAEA